MVAPASCSQIDDTFGPWAGACRGGFDFTLLFEETILSLLPLGLLLLVVPPRISYLIKRNIKVDQSRLPLFKLVCALLACIPLPSGSLHFTGGVRNLRRDPSRTAGAMGETGNDQNQNLNRKRGHPDSRCLCPWSFVIHRTPADAPAFICLEYLVVHNFAVRHYPSQNIMAARVSIGDSPCYDRLTRHQGCSRRSRSN